MFLSNREREILEHISSGLTVKEIAELVFLSPHTIISYRRNLLRKLDAKNGAEMVRKAFEQGYFQANLISQAC